MTTLSVLWQSTLLGALGVAGFSLILPATRLAVADAMEFLHAGNAGGCGDGHHWHYRQCTHAIPCAATYWPQISLGQPRLTPAMQEEVVTSAVDMFLKCYGEAMG